MQHFTFNDLYLLHLSLFTRIQRVETLLEDFTQENDVELFNSYNKELAELQELETKIAQIRKDEIKKI